MSAQAALYLAAADDLEAALRPVAGRPVAFRSLSDDFNSATQSLSRVLGDVSHSVRTIKLNSGEIHHAALDLAQRTEQQAAALQESAPPAGG